MSALNNRLSAKAATSADGRVELRSPGVGEWVNRPLVGHLIAPGSVIGHLVVLGFRYSLFAPEGALGRVVSVGAESAVDFEAPLLVLDPEGLAEAQQQDVTKSDTSSGLALRAASSGRYYSRPAPDKPAFVSVGDIINAGHVIGLLEVMKTFNRIQYGGDELPSPARVIAIGPDDGADVEAGDVLIRVEAAS